MSKFSLISQCRSDVHIGIHISLGKEKASSVVSRVVSRVVQQEKGISWKGGGQHGRQRSLIVNDASRPSLFSELSAGDGARFVSFLQEPIDLEMAHECVSATNM